jgi:large subunit ribosomal protein L10
MAHVAKYKKEKVEELAKLFEQYPAIGLINMEHLPASQLQKMRSQLREDLLIVMSKKNLMKLAMEKSKKKGLAELDKYLEGMPCLIFTKNSPFRIALKLKRSKTMAAAKPGQTAPRDLTILAGPTPFSPGPVLGELGQMGIKAGVDKGKIVVKEDKLVAKKGEKITQKTAAILQKFGIEPMEIGLNLVAFYEDGIVYNTEVLDIDDKKTKEQLARAASWAVNLAMEASYPTKETISMLVGKAYRQASSVESAAKPQ